jgi:hypothetical protein
MTNLPTHLQERIKQEAKKHGEGTCTGKQYGGTTDLIVPKIKEWASEDFLAGASFLYALLKEEKGEVAGVWRNVSQLPEIVNKKALPCYVRVEKRKHDGSGTWIQKAVAYYFPDKFKGVEFEDWDDYSQEDFPYTEEDSEQGVVWLRAGWYSSIDCDKCEGYWSAPLNVVEWLDTDTPVVAGCGELVAMLQKIRNRTSGYSAKCMVYLRDYIDKEIELLNKKNNNENVD